MRGMRWNLSSSATLRFAAVIAGVGLACSASAATRVFVSQVDPSSPIGGYFQLDFGDGVDRTSNITSTTLAIEVDDATGAARFISYFQSLGSITLPGGVETGALTIAIVPGSSSGTFDESTGALNTTDTYAITFANDLSAFGLASPVQLPGDSGGNVMFVTSGSGTLDLAWDGVGQLANPFDPPNPIVFTYTCNVTQRLAIVPGCDVQECYLADLNADCQVGLTDLATLLANFGSIGVERSAGELTGDSSVTLEDLATMLTQFGNDCTN